MKTTNTYQPTQHTGATPTKIQRARELRRTMTPEERLLWQDLRPLRSHGYVFRRQQVIGGFIADFYCPPCRPRRRGGWPNPRTPGRV